MLHCFVQYYLHLQLVSAVNYLHQLGVSLKKAICRLACVATALIHGLNRSDSAWIFKQVRRGYVFGLGAELGTANIRMGTLCAPMTTAGGVSAWPRYRNILMPCASITSWAFSRAFGRISSEATQGLLGYLHPALGVTTAELAERGIEFDPQRDCAVYPSAVAQLVWCRYGRGDCTVFADRNQRGCGCGRKVCIQS